MWGSSHERMISVNALGGTVFLKVSSTTIDISVYLLVIIETILFCFSPSPYLLMRVFLDASRLLIFGKLLNLNVLDLFGLLQKHQMLS